MILSENDKREMCPQHGWVGRLVFQRDRHDLCEGPVEESALVDVEDAEVLEDVEEEAKRETAGSPEEGPPEEVLPPRGRGSRGRSVPSKKTVAIRQITRIELAAGRLELRELGADAPYWRPRTRGDCERVARPCPYVACSQNLYLDVSRTGSIILNFPHLEPWQMAAKRSCALDLAARGGMTLEEIAEATNLTRERIRQVELKTLERRARPAAVELGLGREDAVAVGVRRQVGPGLDLAETGVDGEVPSDVATLLAGDDSGRSG